MNRKIDSDTNDTEGHAVRIKPDDKGIDTDTEGHGFKPKGVEDADTEGHGRRLPDDKKGVEDADTEGHAMRGKP